MPAIDIELDFPPNFHGRGEFSSTSQRLPPQPITVELVAQPAPEYSEVEARGACHRDSNLVLIGEKCLPGTSDGRESQESIKGGRRAS